MAITASRVREAVERFLPRTVVFAADATSGLTDKESVFLRVMQVVNTSMLLSEDTPYYLTYEAAQRWREQLVAALGHLQVLSGGSTLRLLRPTAPVKVDTTGLSSVRSKLGTLQGNLSNGFGDSYHAAFEAALGTFLSDQIGPHVRLRNREIISAEVREAATSLQSIWSDLHAGRAAVFAVLSDYADQDLRAAVASSIIDSITARIDDLVAQLDAGTAAENVEMAEDVLLDLAAARAALSIVQAAPEPSGADVVGPSDDGVTPPDYLLLEGHAAAEPAVYVTRGESGYLSVTKLVYASTGAAVDDGDGDTLTPTFQDLVEDFSAISEGNYLTLIPSGQSHRIVSVAAHELELDPEIPNDLSGATYAICAEVPGAYFKDDEQSFLPDVRAGMDLIAGDRKLRIAEVVDGTTLRLDPPAPLYIGTSVPYVIVTPGTPSGSSRLVDLTADFPETLVGQPIHLMLDRPVIATVTRVGDIDNDGANELLEVDRRLRIGRRGAYYRVLSHGEGLSDALWTSEDLSSVLEDDAVTVWGFDDLYVSKEAGELSLKPLAPAGRSGLSFVVARGGSSLYGRHRLFEHLNDSLDLAEGLDDFTAFVAEVLVDYGESFVEVAEGVAGEVLDDLDGDSTSQVALLVGGVGAAALGDKLVLMIEGEERQTYLTAVSGMRVTVSPEVPIGVITSWSITRTSISYTLAECATLEGQVQGLIDLIDGYVLPAGGPVAAILALLQEQGLDRVADLVRAGDVTALASASLTTSTYASAAKAAAQQAGASATATTSWANTTPSAAAAVVPADAIQPEQDTRIALARGIARLAAYERLQTAAGRSLDEQRNRAIYEITGESGSGVDDDPTLPWLEATGSRAARLQQDYEELVAAVDYMLAHPEEFEDA